MTKALQQSLEKRLHESIGQKDVQLARMKQLQSDLEMKRKKIPKRPQQTVEELHEKIQALERQRTITSMSLAEERKTLKEIALVEKNKRSVEEYVEKDEEIKSLKEELHGLRDALKTTLTGLDEIREALEKVKLANELDCTIEELLKKELDCPDDKVGKIIGKKGSMLSSIRETCNAYVEVDEKSKKLIIFGTRNAIRQAEERIQRITEIVEEEITLEDSLSEYLSSKDVDVIKQLREEYPGAYINVTRTNRQLFIQSVPKEIDAIRTQLLGLKIVVKERQLTAQEAINVVGRKGATIDQLCSDYSIVMKVAKIDESKSLMRFIGKVDEVETAIAAVEELLESKKDVVKSISISPVKKYILLADGGRYIKSLQANITQSIPDGHCHLSVNRNRPKENSELLVKSIQSFISQALEHASIALQELDEHIVEVTVDQSVLSRIIGKNGETIKKLTKGRHAVIEFEEKTGLVSYGATSLSILNDLKKEIDEILERNFVLRIPTEPSVIKRQYYEFNRSSAKQDLDGCWLNMDEAKSCFVLRGNTEAVERAKPLIEDFILNNQFIDIHLTNEDCEALLSGGKQSKIAELSKENDIDIQVDRVKFLVTLRGPKEKLNEIEEKLNQYLNGGNGHSVTKFLLNEQVVGKIIGKGGKTRRELEQKFNGVAIKITKSHVVIIRGPDQAVTDCRIEIAKIVASARVEEIILITEEEKSILKKKDYVSRIIQQVPVNLTTKDSSIVCRGMLYEVRDAVSLLNEMLTGEWTCPIELDTSQFAKLRCATKDPSHFKRIEKESGVKVDLDLSASSILICGKRNNVKRAKEQLYGFLDFVLPKELHRIKISKPLFMSVGRSSSLAEVAAEAGGVAMTLDRDLSFIVIRSPCIEKLQRATSLLEKRIAEAERLAFVIELTPADSWIIPALIGKKGEKIALYRSKYPSCRIDISTASRTITVVGKSEDEVLEVRGAIKAAIETVRKENMFIVVPDEYVPRFVGKGGSHIKDLCTKHGVDIQKAKRGVYNFKISGNEAKVQSAKDGIEEWILLRQKENEPIQFELERRQELAVVLGPKGIVAQSIQDEFQCKIDVDKNTLVVTVRAPDERQRQAAVTKMQDLLEMHRLDVSDHPDFGEKKTGFDEKNSNLGENGTVTSGVGEFGHPLEKENCSEVSLHASDHVKQCQPSPALEITNENQIEHMREGTEGAQSLFAMLIS